jgi:hypothetical protein
MHLNAAGIHGGGARQPLSGAHYRSTISKLPIASTPPRSIDQSNGSKPKSRPSAKTCANMISLGPIVASQLAATLPEDVRRGCRIPATLVDKAPENQKFPAAVASVQPSCAPRAGEIAHMNPAFGVGSLHRPATISPQPALTIGPIHLLFAVSVRLAFTDQRPEKPHQSAA